MGREDYVFTSKVLEEEGEKVRRRGECLRLGAELKRCHRYMRRLKVVKTTAANVCQTLFDKAPDKIWYVPGAVRRGQPCDVSWAAYVGAVTCALIPWGNC